MYNIEIIEKCLSSDFDKYPSRKNYILGLINSDENLEVLTVFYDEVLDMLLDFSCRYKSEVSKQGLNHMLYLTDIINPVMDDEESYQARKYEITEREKIFDLGIDDFPERELDLGDFPSSVENLKEMESTQVFGQDEGKPHYAYSLDALIKAAVNNKKH